MTQSSNNLHVVIGLGVSGISCVRYLIQQNIPVALIDTRQHPPQLAEFKQIFPHIPVSVGKLDSDLLARAAKIIISPGISVKEPIILQQIARGIPVIGDIELFANAITKPVIAITGTNAKSTVTTLVGEMAVAANLQTQVGGNLGIPALDLITTPAPDVFVLELSSFQLETTYSLKPRVATILNITEDHMDRYASLEDYALAKHRIYMDCDVAVCNRDDIRTESTSTKVKRKLYFTLGKPQQDEFGILQKQGQAYLAYEKQFLMPVKDLPLLGQHSQANALAALAIGYGYGLPFAPMLETLMNFKGLPHRCQFIREHHGVRWYNDSKGTNVGATLAALSGLGSEIQGKVILIAGGVGKGADFTSLIPALAKYVKKLILIGEAASLIAAVAKGQVEISFANSMADAVELAQHAAAPADCVLLSPACASFDMFNNFEHRGEVFAMLVQGLS